MISVTTFTARTFSRIRLLAGLILLVAGIVINRNAFNTGAGWGADLAQLYLSGWMLREGKNIYDLQLQHQGYLQHIGYITTWGHFYPPAPAVLMLPITLISYSAAREAYFVILVVGTLVALWRAMSMIAPRWSNSSKILVSGLVMCAAATRWSFKVAQPGPLMLALFALFVAELSINDKARTWILFATASFVAAMKITFGMPFILMAIAVRRWKLAAAIIAFSAALNLIGMYGMGGPSIIPSYRANMADFERADQLNYPDPRGFNSLARTDWPYLLNAVQPSFVRNTLIGYALTLMVLGWLGWEIFQAGGHRFREDRALLALTGPIVAISMLAVYHHHYDMDLMLFPVIGYAARPDLLGRRGALLFVLPVTLYVGTYPYQKFAQLVDQVVGPRSVLLTKPLASAVCVVALVGSCLLLREVLRECRPLKEQ